MHTFGTLSLGVRAHESVFIFTSQVTCIWQIAHTHYSWYTVHPQCSRTGCELTFVGHFWRKLAIHITCRTIQPLSNRGKTHISCDTLFDRYEAGHLLSPIVGHTHLSAILKQAILIMRHIVRSLWSRPHTHITVIHCSAIIKLVAHT